MQFWRAQGTRSDGEIEEWEVIKLYLKHYVIDFLCMLALSVITCVQIALILSPILLVVYWSAK